MAADFILDTVAVCFAVFFMTAPLSQAIDVCGTPAKVRYVNPINLLCFSLNCITQLAYGLFLPVPPVVPCNAYGVFVGIFSTSACWCFARKEPHAKHWDRTAAFATAFTGLLAALIFAYAAFGGAADVGVLGMMVGIIMYGAPLSSMKEVLRTKSSETLPVMQSFLGFLNSSCWFTVGVRTGKVPVWGPNIIGMMLSLLQLALIFKFPAKPAGDLEDEDFIPLLAEHSLADVARDTSREWKEAIVEHSHSISLFMKKSSQDLVGLFSHSPRVDNEYISLDGDGPLTENKKKVIEGKSAAVQRLRGASSIAVADRQELFGIQTSRDTAENQPRATSEGSRTNRTCFMSLVSGANDTALLATCFPTVSETYESGAIR